MSDPARIVVSRLQHTRGRNGLRSAIVSLLESGAIKPIVAKTFPLAEALMSPGVRENILPTTVVIVSESEVTIAVAGTRFPNSQSIT